jgi:hypothetical protein
MTAQSGAQSAADPMQGRVHSTERDAGTDRDLTVTESFDVGEMNNHPLPVWHCPQCCGQIRVQAAEYFNRSEAASASANISCKRLPEHVFGPHLIGDYRHSRFIGA